MTAVGSMAGEKLKAKSGWNDYNGASGNGTDEFGFSALPGGDRYTDGYFYGAGYYGFWWTAAKDGAALPYNRYMGYKHDLVFEGTYELEFGFAVRCVRD